MKVLNALVMSILFVTSVIAHAEVGYISHQFNDLVWDDDNLCKRITEENGSALEIVSLEEAKSGCPQLEDYSKVEEAYATRSLESFAVTGLTVQTVVDCKDLSYYKTAKVGQFCKSDAGFTFRKVRDARRRTGWLDLATEKIWYDNTNNNVNHFEATDHCEDQGLILASEKDMELAAAHGIREAQRKLAYPVWGQRTLYWTSDLKADNAAWALGYYEGGEKDFGFRINRSLYSAALCISK